MGKVIKEEDLRLNIIVNGNDTRQKIGELSRSVEDLNTKNQQLEAQRKKLRAEGQKESQQYKDLTAQINTNKATIKGYQQQINSLRSSIKVSEMTMGELQQRAKQLNAQLRNAAPGTKQYDQLAKKLREVNTRMVELRANVKGVSGVMGKLGLGGLQSLIGKLFIYYQVIRGIFKFFSSGFKTLKDFEQANVNLSTILGVSITQMVALTKSALELGRTTEYTASQVTNLQTELAKLGFGQQAILEMQKPVLQFATAVGAELPAAAALAGATLRAFDKDASDTDEVLATMAVGCNKSALSFEYLQTSMSIVAPVAKTFGFGIKDVVTLLGTLANSGFDASSAATATRNILLNLADANGKLAKALGKPVHSLPELVDGLKQLDEKGINLSKTLELTDKRSVAAFNTFLRGTESMEELRESVENVNGELKRIQEDRLNSVEGSIKLMKSAWEGFVLSMYDSRGTIKTVIDWLTAGINGVNDLLLGKEGRRAREDSNIATSINKTVTTQFKSSFETSEGKTTDEKIEQTTAVIKEKLQKRMYEIWEGIVDKDFIDKAISEGLQQAADFVREAEDKKQDEDARSKRQKQQEAAAAAYKALTEKEIAERIALKKKFLAGDIASEEEYNNILLQLNINALKRRLKSSELKGKERLTAEEQLTTLLLQQKKQEQDKLDKIEAQRIKSITDPIEKEEALYIQQQKKYAGNTAMLEQLAKNHARKLTEIKLKQALDALKIEEEQYKNERAILVKHQAEELSLTGLTNIQRKKLKKEHIEELKALDAAYYSDALTKVQKLFSDGQIDVPTAQGLLKSIDLDSALLSEEEKKQLQAMIDTITAKLKEAQSAVAELGYSFTNKQGDILGFSQDDWELFFENIRNGKFGAEELSMALSAAAEAGDMALELYSEYDKMMSAKENASLKKFKKDQDVKKKSLDNRLDAGLMSQEQHDAETERLDAEYDKKQEELQIKQAKRQKAMSLTQVAIDTAAAVGKAIATYAWPFSLIPIAFATATGAAKAAMIASTPIAGAEAGGFPVERAQDGKKFNAQINPDARGYINSPTVLVGENGLEYVIPAEAMQNPTARPIIDLFETVRKQGALSDFNFEEVLPALYAIPGRASGGSLSQTQGAGLEALANIPASGTTDPALYKLLYEAIVKLTDKLNDPLDARVVLMGDGGFLKKMEEYDRMKNKGKIG